MATKNAERQAKYREKHLKSEDGALSRLNVMVDFQAKLKLERLAAYYAVTQKEMFERLMGQAESSLIASMPGELVGLYYDKKFLDADNDAPDAVTPDISPEKKAAIRKSLLKLLSKTA